MLHHQTTTFGGLTPQRVPEAYIRAEVASLPLASEDAFHLALTELQPSLSDESEEGEKTRTLWRKCEELLSEHASGASLDRLIAIRDYYWFDYNAESHLRMQPNTPLHAYLSRLASRHVYSRPGISEIVNSENFFESATRYRWLTFALPEDLLLNATKVSPPPTCIDIDPPLFTRCLLDRGVSEIHQHIGAAMDFKTFWMSTLAALARPDLDPNSISDPEVPFKKCELFFRWLLAAVISRSVLMEYLVCGTNNEPFAEFVLTLKNVRGQLRRTLEKALLALAYANECILPGFYSLAALYQEIHPHGYALWNKPPRTIDQAWCLCDPIAVRMSLRFPNEGEVRFVRKCLGFIKRRDASEQPDKMFNSLFWQVIRVRNLLYRSVVQRPMTAGLQWFIRFSNRLWPLRTPLDAIRTEISYEVAGGLPGNSIASLEIRNTAKKTSVELAKNLCELIESWKHVLYKYTLINGKIPEFGVVLLFVKTRDPDNRWECGNPPAYGSDTHGEPLPQRSAAIRLGGRFANYFQTQATTVKAAANLFNAKPSILWVLRGMDVAADELSIPTWVLVPLYRFLERESTFAAAAVKDVVKPSPLRITAHAGEDFRHLMEGMRRIFECVHYLLRRSGGRLGHATALGYAPRQWAEHTGSVMMPVEERLWDLVFEWRLYTGFQTPYELRISVPQGRVGYLENQIRALSNRVFGGGYEPKDMALVHHTLHTLWSGPEVNERQTEVGLDTFSLDLKELNPAFYFTNVNVAKIIESYRKSEIVFRRGQQLETVIIDESEIGALEAVQDALRRLVSIRGIVAEVNPSSNLLIGNMLDLRNHPTLRLFPPEPQEGSPPPIRIAIGSDDPIIFCTHLIHEYTLLYNAALSAGYSENCVGKWLEEVRCTSMDARFTLPWPEGADRADLLLNDLYDFLQRSDHFKRERKREKPFVS